MKGLRNVKRAFTTLFGKKTRKIEFDSKAGEEQQITEIPIIPKDEEINVAKYDKQWESYIKNYEKNILPARKFDKKIRILAISDTHNNLNYANISDDLIDTNNKGIDLCILLGDISTNDLKIITSIIPINKTIGILGNHDSFGFLDRYKIKNMNLAAIETKNNVCITGIQGSIKYKEWKYPSFTQTESINAMDKLCPADIVISHDTPYDYTSHQNTVHKGLIGISKYIYDKQVPINIHGHLHNNRIRELPNGAKSIGIYGISYIVIDRDDIQIEKIPFIKGEQCAE